MPVVVALLSVVISPQVVSVDILCGFLGLGELLFNFFRGQNIETGISRQLDEFVQGVGRWLYESSTADPQTNHIIGRF